MVTCHEPTSHVPNLPKQAADHPPLPLYRIHNSLYRPTFLYFGWAKTLALIYTDRRRALPDVACLVAMAIVVLRHLELDASPWLLAW